MVLTGTRHEWKAADGATFSYSRWGGPGGEAPRAVVVAVHGLSGAALDFEPLGKRLLTLRITTLAVELRGQGNDPLTTRRGDLAVLEDWFADLAVFLAQVRRQNPGIEIYCYGESLGAALLVRFLAQAAPEDQPAGLVLASPVVAVPRQPSWVQMSLFRFFFWARPTFRINVGKLAKGKSRLPPPHVTRDEAHRQWFETAPHRMVKFTIRFLRCLYLLIDGCFAAAPLIEVPVLLIYPRHDVFIKTAKVEEFFGLLGSEDKELTLFPDAFHLLLHDNDRELVLDRIVNWLEQRVSFAEPKNMAPRPGR